MEGIILCWSNYLPLKFWVGWAPDGELMRYATVPDLTRIPKAIKRGLTQQILVPFRTEGKEAPSVRYICLIFPKKSLPRDAILDELRFIFDDGPAADAEYSP